jgi:hypothetical protein
MYGSSPDPVAEIEETMSTPGRCNRSREESVSGNEKMLRRVGGTEDARSPRKSEKRQE